MLVCWLTWRTLPAVDRWKDSALRKAIGTRDSLEAFKRVLHSDLEHVIVSPEDFATLLAESQLPFDPTQYLGEMSGSRETLTVETSHTDQGPLNQVESALVEIWRRVFGLADIGIHDDFLTLGGHSLLAMQIVAQIRSITR
jgi:hypothetical protein